MSSWMVPRQKLDPDQNRFLDQLATARTNKNYWIRGFAGSGKSVLIVWALVQAKKDNPDLSACVVLFTHSLIDMVKTGIPDDLDHVPVMTYHKFKKNARDYDLILVDEVQDLPEDVLRTLKKHAGQLIVAGDEAQSIYTDRVEADDIPEVAGAESFGLNIIHRLTRKIIEIAQNVFPSKRLEEAKQQRLASVDVKLGKARSEQEETEFIWKKASAHAKPGAPSAILLPHHDAIVRFANQVLRLEDQSAWDRTTNYWGKNDYYELNRHLEHAGLNLMYLGNKYGSLEDTASSSKVVLMTYHSAKGLDFETVFLPRLTDRTTIWDGDEELAKTLFFVALTRSRRDLYVTHTATPHRFVKRMPERLVHEVPIPEPEPEPDEPVDIGPVF